MTKREEIKRRIISNIPASLIGIGIGLLIIWLVL